MSYFTVALATPLMRVVLHLCIVRKGLLCYPLEAGADSRFSLLQDLLADIHHTHRVAGLSCHLATQQQQGRKEGKTGLTILSLFFQPPRPLTCAIPEPMSPLPIMAMLCTGAGLGTPLLSSLQREARGTSLGARLERSRAGRSEAAMSLVTFVSTFTAPAQRGITCALI